MFQEKVLKKVQAGMQFVPAPVTKVMKTAPVMTGCVVVGGALTAYGTGKCSGSQAVAGTLIGFGTIGLQYTPKLLPLLTGAVGSIGGLIKRK